MTGRTNYTGVDNNAAMQGPAQITAVYEHFDALIGSNVDTENSLPLSGNWLGRSILVADTGIWRIWLGARWGYGDGDTGWIALPLNNGWVPYLSSTWGTPAYRRRNGKVQVQGVVQAKSGYTANLCTLPTGYRPPNSKQFAAWIATNSGNIVVTAAGLLVITGSWNVDSTISLGELEFSVN